MKARVVGLRIALAALVITFVATRVPWSDRVRPEGDDRHVTGVLVGDWRADSVGFIAEDPADVPADWDGEWVAVISTGSEAQISRSGGVEWEPGLIPVLRNVHPSTLLGVFTAILLGIFCGVTRWWRLLRASGVPTPYGTVLRLTLLGMFFNLVVPGLTGGDVVKAGLAAKEHPQRRGAAIMAVGLDRVIGLWTLIWIAALASLALRDQLSALVTPLMAFALLCTAGMAAFTIPSLRGALGLKWVLSRAPKRLSGMVDAMRAVAEKPTEVVIAIILSVANHLCIGAAVFTVSSGLGDSTPFLGCLSATAIASAVSAIPLAPGGWGVGEAAYAAMFARLGSQEAVGYAVSVTLRLSLTATSLICGAALWRRGRDDWREEIAHDAELTPFDSQP